MSPDPTITTREATPSDTPFLFRVFASTRATEFAWLPLPRAQKTAFLRQQFTAQQGHYRGQYPQARFLVIERNRQPVGRMCLADTGDADVVVVDIALLPEFRGQGIGTHVLAEVLWHAEQQRRGVTLSVVRGSAARRLYARLGFVDVHNDGAYVQMVRDAPAVVSR